MKGRPRLYTDGMYVDCARAYASGESLAQAGSTHGMTAVTLSVWMEANGLPRRKVWQRDKRNSDVPLGAGDEAVVEYGETINLLELTDGECMRLKGLCEFKRCRFHCRGGGCAIKIGGNGAHTLEDVSALVGISRNAVQDVIIRSTARIRKQMKGWQ